MIRLSWGKGIFPENTPKRAKTISPRHKKTRPDALRRWVLFLSFGLLMKEIPIWQKSNLNLKAAATYFGIRVNKLLDITNDESCKFVLWVGNKRLIKRRLFDLFIEQAYSI